jgi:uncharacterized protein
VTRRSAGVLGASQGALEQRLAAYAQRTGHQLAVLVIPSLEGEVLEQYSMKVAEQWRLGDKKRDDGLLLLVAMKEHEVRIEVGYGLEGAVTDAVSSRIIRDVMIPRFQQDDPAGAIDAGVDALMRAAEGESVGPAPSSPAVRTRGPSLLPILFVVFFAMMGAPRFMRALIFGALGFFGGWLGFSSLVVGGGLAAAGFVLGLVLPTFRGRGRGRGPVIVPGPWIGWGGGGWGGGGWSSGGGGGFSGGGGGLGGGGASGKW